MPTIYSWSSPGSEGSDNYQELPKKFPPSDPDEFVSLTDPDRDVKLAALHQKGLERLAELKPQRDAEDAIDDARRDRLIDLGCDPERLQGLALLPFEIAIFCLDRPHRMFVPRDIYKECQPIETLLEHEQRASKDPGFSKAARVRQECEFLSQQCVIGVSTLRDGKYEFGFGFLWDEEEEVPEIPPRFESLLRRESDLQIGYQISQRSKRDQAILDEQNEQVQAQLRRLNELRQRYVERNQKFLSENVRNWRVPGIQ